MTIEAEPQSFSSVNSSLVYVVYDVDYSTANYKYVADIHIASVLVFRAVGFPNPVNNRGIFDLSDVIRQYVASAFKDEQGAGEFSLLVEVNFREQKAGVLSGILVTSSLVFTNNYLVRGDSRNVMQTLSDKPATNRPRQITMPEDCTTFYLPYFVYTAGAITVIKNAVSSTVTPVAVNSMLRINIAIGATADYSVSINGVVFTVNVVCAGLYNNYVIHFLNKWGGWESILFNKVSRKAISAEKKGFQKLPYRVSAAGLVSYSASDVMHQQGITYGVLADEKLRISTDLLNDAEYQWLYQLIISPSVYLQDGVTVYPVNIENSDYEFKESIVDNLTNLTIDVSFGNKFLTQFQ